MDIFPCLNYFHLQLAQMIQVEAKIPPLYVVVQFSEFKL